METPKGAIPRRNPLPRRRIQKLSRTVSISEEQYESQINQMQIVIDILFEENDKLRDRLDAAVIEIADLRQQINN